MERSAPRGAARDRIASRIALTKLPDHVQDRVHAHQISLHEAEAMCEFANDPSAIEALLPCVGKQSFQYHIEQRRHQRAVELRIVAVRRQLREAGVRIIDRPHEYPWRSIEKPVGHFIDPAAEARPDGTPAPFSPETHAAACSFHAAFVNTYDCKPEYVCCNPAEAGHDSVHERAAAAVAASAVEGTDVDVAAAEADRLRHVEETRQRAEEDQRRRAEAEQAEAERRQALEVAARLRRSFLTTLVRRSGRAHLQAVLRLLLTENFQAWLTDAELEDTQQLAGLIDARLPDQATGVNEDDRWEDIVRNLRATLDTRRSPDGIAGALLAIVGHNREWALAQGHGWGDSSCRRYMDFLVAQGYEPTELERELLHGIEVID